MTPPAESATTSAVLPAALKPARGRLQCLRLLLGWLLVGVVAGLLVALSLPTALGGRALTVMSGSMAPTIETGDVVAVRGVRASQVAVPAASYRTPEYTRRDSSAGTLRN